jgi:hypothetical protein
MPAPVALAAIPIITAAGRFAAPYLAKELGKLGMNKFVSTYGKGAFNTLESLNKNTTMVKPEAMPMVNPNYMSSGSDDDDTNVPMVQDQQKSNQPQQEPPEDKGPNLGTEVATEAALQISKNLSKQEDIKSQTQKALEPKVEFGTLTETEKQTAQALMGDKPEFYSRAVDAIKNAKQNKFTKGKWKSIVQSNSTKEEMDYLGLSDYLQGNESITKQDLLDFVEQKNIADKLSVVEVPLEDQYDFTAFSIGGAGGKRARASESTREVLGAGDVKLPTMEGYKSSVEQYVFQVDGPKQWSADSAHFSEKYARNAIAHARAQTGYFNADAVEKRLDEKEAEGTALSNEDKILKNASRQLEDTFIVDEIQSDAIQDIQKYGTKDDFVIIKGKDITQDFLQKNYPNYAVRSTPVSILEGKSNQELKDEGLIAARDNNNVLYSVDPDRDITSERGVPEVRLMDNNFYVFDKNTLVTKGSYKTKEQAQKQVDLRGYEALPVTESKKYVELILNAMIKKAVEKDLDSIGITNGQIQFDRYEGQPMEDKEGLKKFYDEIVYKQLEKIADKYNVKLETVELPGKGELKEFDDVGLNEPTEESDARSITRRTTRALRDGFVLREVSGNLLANTINDLVTGRFEDPERADNPAVTLPDYTTIFTETGRASGESIIDNLIADNPDIDNDKKYYMWVVPNTPIDNALQSQPNYSSLSGVWDIADINLQMPISSVMPSGGTDINNYNSYILEYFDKMREKSSDIGYKHEIIKMKLPKKLQKDILSKPIKLSKAKQQTDRLFA